MEKLSVDVPILKQFQFTASKRKFQGNPWSAWNWWESIEPVTQKTNFDSCATQSQKN